MTPLRTAWIPAALASAALATQAAATLVPFATPVELPLAGTATRSVTAWKRNSSGSMPPSSFSIVLRWKPLAMIWSGDASSSMSPASCSTTKRS